MTNSTTSMSGHCGSDPRIERTRAAVLEAGVIILFAKGPEAVTHAAVANDARVSRTTIYKHWPKRGDLLVDVLRQVEPRKRIDPSGDLRADMQKMGRLVAASFQDQRLNKVFSSLMAQAQWDDDTSQAQKALLSAGMADIGLVLDAAVAAGELPAGIDPLRTVGRLVGPIFFAALIAREPLTTGEVEVLVDDWLVTLTY
ncbi:MAG: TetR/AcrR family transcriptional regulator [Ilumatobacter sp.]|nr:TetR/AcrR family transcriptional regulator [Ilumatobacter sp.]